LPPPSAGPYVHLILSTDVQELEEAKPGLSERTPGPNVSTADDNIETYVERCRRRIPSFVNDNFSLEQTWALQRPTLWFDLACAPINSAWALPHLAIQKAAETAEKIGYPQPTRWAKHLPQGITTGYQRQIERRIRRDLLEWDREPDRELSDLVRQFSSGRAIVSDLIGTILTLGMSWAIMGSTSLSLNGLARGMARKSAHDRAASRFFLGKKAGSAFYNAFPPAVHESTTWTILCLLVVGLTVAAMACTILSDPLRKALGFHRHRLEALLDDMERELIVLSHKKMRPKL
jgi:hypothetical protein